MHASTRTVAVLEKRVFLGAVAIGLVHAVDDAVLNRQPGVPADQHLAALAVVTAVGVEIPLNQIYAEAAGEQVELWALPEVAHTNAIDQVGAEYERRVVEEFDRALLTGMNRP